MLYSMDQACFHMRLRLVMLDVIEPIVHRIIAELL